MPSASIAPRVDGPPLSTPPAPRPLKVGVLTASTSRLAGGMQQSVCALTQAVQGQDC